MSLFRAAQRQHQRSQRQSTTKRWEKTGKRAAYGALVAAAVLAAAILTPRLVRLFTISQISCQVEGLECPQQVHQALSKLQGTPIIFADTTSLINTSLKPHGYQLESFKKNLPSSIHIRLISAPLFYLVHSPQGLLGVSTDGTIAALSITIPDVPEFQSSLTQDELTQNNSIHPQFHTAFSTLIANAHTPTDTKHISLNARHELHIEDTQDELLVILDPFDIDTSLARWQSAVHSKEFEAVATTSASLDVRFKLPVLRIRK